MKPENPRHRAREFALQVLFQREFLSTIQIEKSLDYFKGTFTAYDKEYLYARQIIEGVIEHIGEIDNKITSHSQNWRIERMAIVDVIIMRIAIYELFYSPEELPPKVVLDEAIEIAKKYSTTESSGFINGILDQVAKKKIS